MCLSSGLESIGRTVYSVRVMCNFLGSVILFSVF